eukprot:226520-Pelagomonas_calceolata.AAC.1
MPLYQVHDIEGSSPAAYKQNRAQLRTSLDVKDIEGAAVGWKPPFRSHVGVRLRDPGLDVSDINCKTTYGKLAPRRLRPHWRTLHLASSEFCQEMIRSSLSARVHELVQGYAHAHNDAYTHTHSRVWHSCSECRPDDPLVWTTGTLNNAAAPSVTHSLGATAALRAKARPASAGARLDGKYKRSETMHGWSPLGRAAHGPNSCHAQRPHGVCCSALSQRFAGVDLVHSSSPEEYLELHAAICSMA